MSWLTRKLGSISFGGWFGGHLKLKADASHLLLSTDAFRRYWQCNINWYDTYSVKWQSTIYMRGPADITQNNFGDTSATMETAGSIVYIIQCGFPIDMPGSLVLKINGSTVRTHSLSSYNSHIQFDPYNIRPAIRGSAISVNQDDVLTFEYTDGEVEGIGSIDTQNYFGTPTGYKYINSITHNGWPP
jgi:hypothetical protein